MSRNNKESNRYDNDDERFVKDINKIEESIGNYRGDGGKRVDDYVCLKGGTVFGERTIATIAQHPDILIGERTLRRWWAYHRIYKEMGAEIEKRCPKINFCDYYELSRVLDVTVTAQEGESKQDASRRAILGLVDWLAAKRNSGTLPSSEFAKMVTACIDESFATTVAEMETSLHPPEEKKPTKPRSKIGNALAFNEIGAATEFLETFCEPQNLASVEVNTTELSLDAVILADSLIRIAKHLMLRGYDSAVRDLIGILRPGLEEIESGFPQNPEP